MLAIAVSLSVYAAIFQLFDGVQIVAANALRGLRDTRSPLWISMASYWLIGLGLGTWLCFVLHYGATGMWWGLVLGAVAANVMMSLRLRQRMKHAETNLETLRVPAD